MHINNSGTFTTEDENYVLSIDYKYDYDAGSFNQPPEEELEVMSVELNKMDMTDSYRDYIDDKVYEQVIEYARNNI